MGVPPPPTPGCGSGVVYSQSETGRQTVLHREGTLRKLDISRLRPICGLLPAECQLECQSVRLCYLRNIFPVFAVGLVATSSTPKMLESFSIMAIDLWVLST